MSRYRRSPVGRPYGSGSKPRLLTSILLLIIVSMIYTQAKDARNWKWLVAQEQEAEQPAPNPKPKLWKEVVIEAPHDGSPEELATSRMQLQAVSDKRPLDGLEMPSYYRLLKWARAQPFEDLEVRAKRHPVYAQFFESADKYRGQLFRLRLHVRRIVEHEDLPQNSADARRVYELWGFTDESKDHPYSIVVPEIPSWFKTGGEVEEECVVVGYFFKLLAYEAFHTNRAAPLFMGRMRPIAGPPKKAASAGRAAWEWAIGGAVLVLVGAFIGKAMKVRKEPSKTRITKGADEGVDLWLQPNDLSSGASASMEPTNAASVASESAAASIVKNSPQQSDQINGELQSSEATPSLLTDSEQPATMNHSPLAASPVGQKSATPSTS